MARAYLNTDEVERLEGQATCFRDRLLIRLLARLGCRVSEVLGIGVADIDFSRGLVTIEHLKTRVKLSCPGCGARLSRTSRFCPGCGIRVEKAVARERERRRVRKLPVTTGRSNPVSGWAGCCGITIATLREVRSPWVSRQGIGRKRVRTPRRTVLCTPRTAG